MCIVHLLRMSITCTHLSWPCLNFTLACVSHLRPLVLALTSASPLIWSGLLIACVAVPGQDTMAVQQQIAEKFWPREGQFLALPCMSAVLVCSPAPACIFCQVLAMLACTALALILQCLHSPCLARIKLPWLGNVSPGQSGNDLWNFFEEAGVGSCIARVSMTPRDPQDLPFYCMHLARVAFTCSIRAWSSLHSICMVKVALSLCIWPSLHSVSASVLQSPLVACLVWPACLA